MHFKSNAGATNCIPWVFGEPWGKKYTNAVFTHLDYSLSLAFPTWGAGYYSSPLDLSWRRWGPGFAWPNANM